MDTGRFEEFYRRYRRLIVTVAHQRLGALADAEDAASEVFRVAAARYAQGEELTLPWLYQTLRNVVGHEYRRRERATALTNKAAAMTFDETLAEASDDNVTIRLAMRSLPEAEKELLYMAYWEDLTGPEIAEILNCSPVAARIRLVRARRHLREVLGEASQTEMEEVTRDGHP